MVKSNYLEMFVFLKIVLKSLVSSFNIILGQSQLTIL